MIWCMSCKAVSTTHNQSWMYVRGGYSLGIGIPFILIAAGWSRAERASKWLRARHRPIQLVGGGLMIAIGVLMVTGLWNSLIADIQTHLVNQFEPVI